MPKLLEEFEIDPIDEETNIALDDDAQEGPPVPTGWLTAQDLSDGGIVTGAGGQRVSVHPTIRGIRQDKGRANTRMAYMWDGTPSMLPLAWNPGGTRHDGARAYLTKRFCLCCHMGGFRLSSCPNCEFIGCAKCANGTDRSPQTLSNGEVINGYIIPCFYLHMEDVPYPRTFYGPIQCFLDTCIRTGDRGFITEVEMRYHARSRHPYEYQAFREAQQAGKEDEVESLKRRFDEMQSQLMAAVATPIVNGPAMDPEYLAWQEKQKRLVKRRATVARKKTQSDNPSKES